MGPKGGWRLEQIEPVNIKCPLFVETMSSIYKCSAIKQQASAASHIASVKLIFKPF